MFAPERAMSTALYFLSIAGTLFFAFVSQGSRMNQFLSSRKRITLPTDPLRNNLRLEPC
jgi:hypothetical protein